MSHTNFDGTQFNNGAGLMVFSALASVGPAVVSAVRNHRDVIATEDAIASWDDLVRTLSERIEDLQNANASLAAAIEQRDNDNMLLVAENATLCQIVSDAGLSVD